MRTAWPYAALSLAVGGLFLVPWQGNYDRIGHVATIPVPSASASPAASTLALLQGGAWWRVEPDYSFFLVYHIAAAQRADWPLLSPMGPLAFLFRGWLPETAVPLLIAWIVIVGLFFFAAWVLARAGGLSPPEAAVWCCALAFVVYALPRDTILLLAPVLLLGVHFVPGCARARDTTAALVAIAALVKTSSLVGAAVALAVITFDEARKRQWPRTFALFSITFVALYAAVGRSLLDLPFWLSNSVEILIHFGEAWSLRASYPLYGALLAITVVALSAAVWRESRLHAIAFALIGATFIKAGFGRADEFHLLISRTALLGLLLLGTVRLSRRVMIGATAAAVLATLPVVSLDELGRQLAAAINPLAAHRASAELFRNEIRGIRLVTPVPSLKESVDWYDARQSVVIASGLAYDPRPVYQGMVAASPQLEKANADHLDGPDAPRWLFYEPFTMDEHLPAAEDALSWPLRLSAYDVAGMRDNVTLLRKRTTPRKWRLQPLKTALIEPGVALVLPSDQPLWAEIDIQPTLRGRVESATLGLPPLFMEISTRQRLARYRIIPSVARGGFLLSPVVTSAAAYAAVSDNRLDLLRPMEARSIRIVGDTRMYSSHVTVRLFRLVIDYTR